MVNEKWLTSSKKVSQCMSEQIPNQKKKIIGGELLSESSSKKEANENLFIHASLDYDHEMVLKSKDWVEKHNPDSKLPNFNTGRILAPESQAVNECLKLTKVSNDPESSKDSGSESLTPLPPLENLQGASSSSESFEGVPFVNNMVIEEPEYEMFFIDFFGDEAFQRMSDINKVGVETLLTYLVMASNITTPENTRFCLKLRKLIANHPNQVKLKSKKVKLEYVGYKLD
ncbi:hypothetical protein Tco_0308301 [Tanacetum coccineum]